MTERSDLANLRALGEPRIHDWAGATEPIGAGLVEWTRLAIGHDQELAVRASLAACALVTGGESSAAAPPSYVDHMLAVIQRWLDEPTRDNREAVRSSLDITREHHAWQADEGSPELWIREAVDHTCLTVWVGERASYIVPIDFATTAGRVVACVYRAMRSAGHDELRAANAIIDVVLAST